MSAIPTLARDNGQWAQASPEQRRWFESLHNRASIHCCADADGYDAQWDTQDGKYRVWGEQPGKPGRWVVVEDLAVVDGPNKAGVAKVWWGQAKDGGLWVRCFMPGTEG